MRITRAEQQSHFRMSFRQMMKEHGPERRNPRAGCDKYGAVSRMAKRKITERLLNVDDLAGLQREQVGRDHALLNPVKAQGKTIAVMGRSHRISAGDLLTLNLFDDWNKLARSKRQHVHIRRFKIEMVNFRRKFPLPEQSGR